MDAYVEDDSLTSRRNLPPTFRVPSRPSRFYKPLSQAENTRRQNHRASALLLKELATEDVDEYMLFLRMTPENFDILLDLITPRIKQRNTQMRNSVKSKVKLKEEQRGRACDDMNNLVVGEGEWVSHWGLRQNHSTRPSTGSGTRLAHPNTRSIVHTGISGHMLAKIVPTFADRRSHVASTKNPLDIHLSFLDTRH
ncbi:unnamed protein product [Timema podura]|uniref:Uncharacterized protein n=1 Tax=Timema podura TaxID=61482 RepID=A0ABN7NNV5_TIMPD|nr:unnamed protein product [Timema podura]